MAFDFTQYLAPFAQAVQQNRPNQGSGMNQVPNQMPQIQSGMPSPMGQPQESGLGNLLDLLKAQPQREEPSFLRKLGTALASFQPATYNSSGAPRGIQFNPQRFEELRDRPYNRKLQDWGTKMGAAMPIAELESKINQENRMLRGQTFDQQLESAKFFQDLQKDARAGRLDEARIQQIYDGIKRNDYISLGQQDDGSYLIMDKKSGQPVQIEGNNLTTEQKIKMQESAAAQRQLMVENARGANQRSVEGLRQEGRKDIEGMRQQGRRELTRAGETLSPTQQSREIYNKAMQVINENPELAPFIQLLPNNTVKILSADEVDLPGFDVASGVNKQENRERALQLVFGPKGQDNELRDEAINLIKMQKLPVTEAGIKWAMEQLRKKD